MTTTSVVTPKQAEKQQAELAEARQPVFKAVEAPKGAPGSHPLNPISSDAEAMRELFFADPADLGSKRCVWDLTAYNAPVLHYY